MCRLLGGRASKGSVLRNIRGGSQQHRVNNREVSRYIYVLALVTKMVASAPVAMWRSSISFIGYSHTTSLYVGIRR